jgi:lipopolysaccharide export system protein LptC
MAVELHLPDLPEVPLSLGVPATPAAPRPVLPWHRRMAEWLVAYLPLLMMLLIALGTWWLVKNTAVPSSGPVDKVLRLDPDYTMTAFTIERFAADGRLKVRLEGEQLRHYPDTDTLEIDQPRIRSYSEAGELTVATARRALSNADAWVTGLRRAQSVTRSELETCELDLSNGGKLKISPLANWTSIFSFIQGGAGSLRRRKGPAGCCSSKRITGSSEPGP